MITVQLDTLKEQLKSAINDGRIYFNEVISDGGSYVIKFPKNKRIARFVYLPRKDRYKFVCDDDDCKRLFDTMSVKYKECPGYKPPYEKSKEAKIFYLQNADDAKEFLLDVVKEYIKFKENNP